MRFTGDMLWNMRTVDAEHWHKWFAWYPVHVNDNDWRWLETVDRKIDFWDDEGVMWEYQKT